MLRISLVAGSALAVAAMAWVSRGPTPSSPRPLAVVAARVSTPAVGPSLGSNPSKAAITGLDSGPGANSSTPISERILVRAFDTTVDVVPMPAPKPLDWLAIHKEPGQTYEEWRVCRRNVPDERHTTIRLVPMGELGSGDFPSVDLLASYAEAFFGMPAKPVSSMHSPPDFATRPGRDTGKPQIRTTDVLDWLERVLPGDAFCAVALTTTDLYPEPSWNYVFGQASFFDRTGVFSFARYDPRFFGEERTDATPALVLRRSLTILSHEIGHMFGMEHCIRFRCLMNGSNHLDETDATPADLCPVCLAKLQHAVGFDPLVRERALEAWRRSHGLLAEADRSAARIARWTAPEVPPTPR